MKIKGLKLERYICRVPANELYEPLALHINHTLKDCQGKSVHNIY